MNTQEQISALKKKVEKVEEKAKQAKLLADSVVTYAKEVNLQTDAIVQLLVEKGVLKDKEHESAFDRIRGLRQRGPLEKIEVGDAVWVTYRVVIDGEEIEQVEFPIRVGAGGIMFEKTLLGKSPESGYVAKVEIPEDYSKKELSGKTLEFDIKIGKVKTKINLEKEMGEAINGSGQ